jgi:hypothetical protein
MQSYRRSAREQFLVVSGEHVPSPAVIRISGKIPMSNYPSMSMPFEYDIVVDTPDRTRVLVVECKRMKDIPDVEAARWRRNFQMHGRDLGAAFFMLASPTQLFLWKADTALEAPPDFTAPAKPVLKRYLSHLADQPGGPLSESLQIAISSWLSDLSDAIREPDPDSEPERMIVQSGLLDKIKGALVRTQVSA